MSRNQKNSPLPPLGWSWSPPALVPGTDEGPGQPTVCITTTYTFSATLLETELLPRFLGLEFDPAERERAFLVEREDALERITAAVLVDQSKVDAHQTTLRWDQVLIRVPGGIQHAKLTVLAWERLVRLIVGSANLTPPGYRHNREVVGTLDFFDDAQSTPREVLLEALAFLERMLGFAAAGPMVLARVQAGIDHVRARVKRWASIPEEFRPREYPQVHFAATLPNRVGKPSQSVLKRIRELWGSGAARDIRLVTPFVGDKDSAFERLTSELTSIPHLRSAHVRLAVPGVRCDGPGGKCQVNLPRRFRDAWAAAWDRAVDDLALCVVTPEADHEGRAVERPLHAKGLFLGDGKTSLLCCGSSNFSASGMGVGRANIEANLCYLDRAASTLDGQGLEDRLPVDWEQPRARLVTWPEAPEPPEEDAEAGSCLVPSVFAWATWDAAAGRIVVGLEPGKPLPEQWEIGLPPPLARVLTSHAEVLTPPAVDRLVLPVGEDLKDVPINAIRIAWRQGEIDCEALMPVNVENRGALPPPEALRGLTAEAILACILAGCSPAEWIEREEWRKNGRCPPPDPELDPHRYHDPSGLALYRVRRLGRALATMGRQMAGMVRTPEAVEYQVFRHPLGPVQLAMALAGEATAGSSPISALDRARLLFSLLEIALMIAHLGREVHRKRQAGEADHRPCFRRAVVHVIQMMDRAQTSWAGEGTIAGAGDSLAQYRRSVIDKAQALLGGLPGEEGATCR